MTTEGQVSKFHTFLPFPKMYQKFQIQTLFSVKTEVKNIEIVSYMMIGCFNKHTFVYMLLSYFQKCNETKTLFVPKFQNFWKIKTWDILVRF